MRFVIRGSWIAVAFLLLPQRTFGAQGVDDPRYVRAFGTLYSTAQLGGLVKAWCDDRAPVTRAATDSALTAWKATHQLDDIERRADSILGAQRSAIDATVLARREAVFRSLDKDSRAPESDCRQMLAYLNRSANPQRLNPAEFRLVTSQRTVRVASAPTTAASTPVPTPVATPIAPPIPGDATSGRGRGTVYRVAQMSAFVARDFRTASARLKRLGQLTVQGTLEAYDERPDATVWLNTVADGWRSKVSVLCYDLSFRRLYSAGRRDVTLRGTVRSVDSWIVLEDCQLIDDIAGLTPSTLSDSGGVKRAQIKSAQVRTAPNGGVAMAQIEGVYQPSKLRYNALTLLFEPDETTYLVLKDGWLYDNISVSPHDLNVVESRRLEPQHWHRWRRRGALLEMQAYDEYGRTDGRWSPLELVLRPTIGARRLNGVFSATRSATAGLIGGGGAMSIGRSSYTFRPDGTFSWANVTQGFASSTNGTGPGGASIVVGGATVGPGGTSVSIVGGGDDEGTYTTEGYTLELRTKRGKVFRFPIFSWDTGKYRDFLVIDGTTYSPPK